MELLEAYPSLETVPVELVPITITFSPVAVAVLVLGRFEDLGFTSGGNKLAVILGSWNEDARFPCKLSFLFGRLNHVPPFSFSSFLFSFSLVGAIGLDADGGFWAWE